MNRLAQSHDSRPDAPEVILRQRAWLGAGPTEHIYVPQRRLGALEAAAATAVIVACVAALASMTGLLPAEMQFNAGSDFASRGQTSAAAIAMPTAAMPTASMIGPAGAATDGMPARLAATSPTPSATAPDIALQAVPIESMNMAAPPAAASAAESPTLTTAAPSRRHRSHGRAARDGSANHGGTVQSGRAGNGTGKTREQVIAELLQAKRDGTYPAQSETYR